MSEQQLLNDGYRKYSGEAIDVFFNTDVCTHSGNCVRGNPEVFDVKRKPWVIADNDTPQAVANTIDTCPSGALKYILKEQSE
jgi:uncharacterized Fe-S cluster protein YjdI